ncbi:ATPase family associated with various cellular activities (AAA) [Azotobacter beijerinckii]|uniref:ATPase family associated with various cellular activities (AAA) n=1 Tax=Azotobacter beijerinckii TaxID=170623 RepID=A0A1H9N4R4_9GAMM|nr:AAA family ATPase [Azotobacter beijerinckii]SER30635.1 ATPase family associated with various cellular activities (AAA) [Azotobacter beijerinckii]
MTSPELTGGAGFTYEDAVAAQYLAAMVGSTTAAALNARVVQRVAQQQADFGEPLDDVIVDAASLADGTVMRLSLQVKRSLTISEAETNRDFREVIQRSWQTLQKPDFREHLDRVGVVTGSVAEETSRAFATVCEWARASDTAAAFMQRFVDDGNASATHRTVAEAVRMAALDIGAPLSDDQLYRLLSHLVLIRFDFLHAGSTHEAEAIVSLQRALAPGQVARAGDLWDLLRQFARDGAGRSAVHTRASLVRALAGWCFTGAPAFAGDMQTLRDSTHHWLDQQADDIGGTHLTRQALRDQLGDQMAAHRLTLIKGLPGTGKTVLLRDLVQELAADGTTLFLAANRLSGRSWSEHARAIGLTTTSIEPLLVEVAATGHSTMLIDGLDRVAPEQRAIVTDLLGQLLTNPTLSDWRVVATARDAGIEPLRNWVPPALLASGGVGYVDVKNLTDEEASSLADSLPALQPLLTGGNERVRTLARRPFFAAVLAQGFSQAAYPSGFAPQSEVDLVEAWWTRGGYDAHAPQALARQRGLIELARHSAPDLGRNARIRDLSTETRDLLPALEEDGLVQQVRKGHTAQFSHDILFEWSFLHLLLDQGDDWIVALTAAGEPPALARVVELLSQSSYPFPDQWPHELHALERAQVRPQWLRAWLVAPVFSPRFAEHVDMFAETLATNDHWLFGKLLVWMQAEKTTPNPMVLSGVLGGDLDVAARIRIADSLGWPSDFAAWSRLLTWAIEQTDSIPDTHLGDLVTLFETWQIAAADYPNAVSQRIVAQCATWLHAIEDEHVDRPFRYSRPANDAAPRPRAPTQLETELRALLLRAARAYPTVVDAYLTKVETIERWSDRALRELMTYAPVLAETHPSQLARVARRWFLEELPDDTSARWRREAHEQHHRRKEVEAIPPEKRSRFDELALSSPSIMHHSFSQHDWDQLSIGGGHQGFFPASPLREPFHSLLMCDPATALALIRDVTNHATTAWRQLHGHWHGSATSLPLVLVFPWGQQEFWGSDRHYVWFRGHGGPQVVECALMALERWAIAQLDAGRPLDEVLQQLLGGHTSIGILGIAVHLALRAQQASPTTLALLRSLRLCRLDLQRKVEEQQLQSAGLIGFQKGSTDAVHRQAVADSIQMTSRRLELRDLVPLFVLGSDAALRDACRAALDDFPNRLEFAYQEEAQNPEHVAELRRTAELWSELGHVENYTAEPVAGHNDVVQISISSPRHEAPEVQASLQRHAQAAREIELWLWVDKCFTSRHWAPGFSMDEAVERARELAEAAAAGRSMSLMPGSGCTEGAIAGTAAAVICFSDASRHEAWADATIESFRVAQDEMSDDTFAGSVIPWHPKIFVAHALAARIKSGGQHPGDREALYRLIVHPLDAVSFVALDGVVGCWEHDTRFAWCGLNLGLRLAQLVSTRDMYQLDADARRQVESDRRTAALAAALNEGRAQGPLPAWVLPRPSWVQTAPDAENPQTLDEGQEDRWQSTDDLWNSQYAAKVLQKVPVAAVMASAGRAHYVDALEAFVGWTLDTINPSWRAERRRGRERGNGNLYEWEDQLGRMVASVAPHLPSDETLQRLLRPIFAQPDEISMRLLAPFTVSLVCGEVLDAPEIRDDTLHLLQAVLERTLEHGDLRRSPHNDGRMGGFDLPELVKSLLFVVVEHAPGAARFANGRWDDLGQVMPLVDRMVRTAGWHPYVARQFVTLCERSGAADPADTFADQMLAQIVDGSLPAGWKGSSVPAAIAALVQAHADRLHPLPAPLARKLLQVLDALVDLGDRRSAALQQSESFRGVCLAAPT